MALAAAALLLGVAAGLRAWRRRAGGESAPAFAFPGSLRHRLREVARLEASGDVRSARALDALARQTDPILSLAAACAWLRVAPREALDRLGPSLVQRDDWPIARVAALFEQLGPPVVTPALVQWMLARPEHGLARLARLARFAQRPRVSTVVRAWLTGRDPPEVLMAALEYIDDENDLPWVRNAAAHDDWRVRMAAAKALARVGRHRELQALMTLLRDPVWWVRYHAAQAITRLEGLAPGELELLHEGIRDAFAADMLGQAMAARRWT